MLNVRSIKRVAFVFLFVHLVNCVSQPTEEKTLLFVGSYTDGKPSAGIHIYEFDQTTGNIKLLDSVEDLINPSYLEVAPNGRSLYSCLDSRMDYPGSVAAFEIDSVTGHLSFINKRTSGGRNPVHVSIDTKNRYVVSSNYNDAGLSIFRVQDDLGLSQPLQQLQFEDSSVVSGRQDKAHLHSTNFYNDGNHLIGMDLGADKLRLFSVNGLGHSGHKPIELEDPNAVLVEPGDGPRHFVLHPNLPYGYCAQELSGKISAFKFINQIPELIGRYDSYQHAMKNFATADVHISDDGKFLYASNRNEPENSISVFKIDLSDGTLNLVEHVKTGGDHPRNFVIDPSDGWLLTANLNSNNIVVFKRDKISGKLMPTDHLVKVNKPSCLKMRTYRIN